MSAAESRDARLLDVGFAGYDGPRGGSFRSVLVLARWSLLRAFGRRRGWVAKAIPIGLAALAFIPGVGVLAVRALLSDRFDVSRLPIDILPFADYLNIVSSIILVWSALVLPELVCPDIRSRTLGLYIATAVSPRQYLAGKVLAAMIAMLGLTLLPILVLFVGNVFFATAPWAYLQDNAGQLPRILGSSLIVSAYWSLLGLAVASLTGRRAFAIGSLLGVVLISVIASAAVTEWTGRDGSGLALNLVAAPILAGRELFKHDPLVTRSQVSLTVAVVCALSAVALLRRYRGRE